MNICLNLRLVLLFALLTLCCLSVYARGGRGGGRGGGGGYGGRGGGGGYGSSSGRSSSSSSSSGSSYSSSKSSSGSSSSGSSSSSGKSNSGSSSSGSSSSNSGHLSSNSGTYGNNIGSGRTIYRRPSSSNSGNRRYDYGGSSSSDEHNSDSNSNEQGFFNTKKSPTLKPSWSYTTPSLSLRDIKNRYTQYNFEIPKTIRPFGSHGHLRPTENPVSRAVRCHQQAADSASNVDILALAKGEVTPFDINRCLRRYKRSFGDKSSPETRGNDVEFPEQTVPDNLPM